MTSFTQQDQKWSHWLREFEGQFDDERSIESTFDATSLSNSPRNMKIRPTQEQNHNFLQEYDTGYKTTSHYHQGTGIQDQVVTQMSVANE